MTDEERMALDWLRERNADVLFRKNGAEAYIIMGLKTSGYFGKTLLEAAKMVGWPGQKENE